MVTVPNAAPVTVPVLLMLATAGLLLLHVPPDVALERLIEPPRQTPFGPVMAATTGNALTVCDLVVLLVQPLALGGVV